MTPEGRRAFAEYLANLDKTLNHRWSIPIDR